MHVFRVIKELWGFRRTRYCVIAENLVRPRQSLRRVPRLRANRRGMRHVSGRKEGSNASEVRSCGVRPLELDVFAPSEPTGAVCAEVL